MGGRGRKGGGGRDRCVFFTFDCCTRPPSQPPYQVGVGGQGGTRGATKAAPGTPFFFHGQSYRRIVFFVFFFHVRVINVSVSPVFLARVPGTYVLYDFVFFVFSCSRLKRILSPCASPVPGPSPTLRLSALSSGAPPSVVSSFPARDEPVVGVCLLVSTRVPLKNC